MASGDAFLGFNEAPIHFPPTFKYDVKRSRLKSFKRPPATPTILTPLHDKMLSDVTEHESQPTAETGDQAEQDADEPEPDAESMVSSAWMSTRSRQTPEDLEGEDDQDDQESHSLKFSTQSPPASASAANLVHKMWSAAAAHKAKEKWMSVFNAHSPRSPSHRSNGSKRSRWRESWSQNKMVPPARRASQPEKTSDGQHPQTPVDPADPRQPKAGRTKELQSALLEAAHARPHKHLALSENNVDLEEEVGVYDSSHKQRVPSW